MDDYDNRFDPDVRLPRLALQEFTPSNAKPAPVAISPGPPLADYHRRRQRSPTVGIETGDLAVMSVLGHA